jgi:hypothetical protein
LFGKKTAVLTFDVLTKAYPQKHSAFDKTWAHTWRKCCQQQMAPADSTFDVWHQDTMTGRNWRFRLVLVVLVIGARVVDGGSNRRL